ncbi:MAG: glycosyltransferase family A protein [Gemmatimonadota bacterium]
MEPLIASLPWAALCVWALLRLVPSPRLGAFPARGFGSGSPTVTVVVPTLNAGHDIGPCLGTLLAARYPNLEIIVADQSSSDGTLEVARAVAERSHRVRVLGVGTPREGWRSRAWACREGARAGAGELLLFSDPDTRHHPEALARAVAALEEGEAAALSLLPRHELETLLERVLAPALLARGELAYLNARLVNRVRDARSVLVNPGFLLVRRAAYLNAGGHEAARADATADTSVARRVLEGGGVVRLLHGERFLSSRAFGARRERKPGPVGALAAGARTARRSSGPVGSWLGSALTLALWVIPPLALALAWGGAVGRWGLYATGLSLLFWVLTYARHAQPILFALTYPVGALATAALEARANPDPT